MKEACNEDKHHHVPVPVLKLDNFSSRTDPACDRNHTDYCSGHSLVSTFHYLSIHIHDKLTILLASWSEQCWEDLSADPGELLRNLIMSITNS